MGFITAGGQSARMGEDKAWLELQGRPLIAHLVEALLPVTSNLAIIANHEEYKKLGFPVFADTHQGIGPLEAIRTAMANSATPNFILVGCDMPFVTSELLSFLITRMAEKSPTPSKFIHHQENDKQTNAAASSSAPLAIVPLNAAARPEPLCAIYSTQALQCVTQLLDSGVRKVSVLFENIPTRFVGFAEIQHLHNAQYVFQNLNTPEDFAATIKIFSALEPQKPAATALTKVQDQDPALG